MNKPIVFVIRSLPSSALAVPPSPSPSLAPVSSTAFLPRRTISHSFAPSTTAASPTHNPSASSSSFSLSSSSSSALSSTAACCGLSRSSCRCHPIYSSLSLNFSTKAGDKADVKPKVTVVEDVVAPPLNTAESAFRATLEPERKANQELYEKRAAVARELSPNHPIATHNADGTRRSSDRLPALIDELLALSITDLKLVIDGMSKKLGLEISAFNAAAAAPPPGAGAAPAGGAAPAAGAAAAKDAKPAAAAAAPAADKKSFDVRLDKFADKDKIKVIKEVRTATGLGLKESKELVESVASGGKIIKKELKKEEAEALVAKLKEAGAEAALV